MANTYFQGVQWTENRGPGLEPTSADCALELRHANFPFNWFVTCQNELKNCWLGHKTAI